MRAKRSLGQNFLRDPDVIVKIVSSLGLSASDTVLEIGPGRGALTKKLVESGATVVAIEIDRELVPELRTQFHFHNNFSVVEANVLETELSGLLAPVEPEMAKLVGNLPYYISTAILQKLAAERQLFSSIVLMLQREVVNRIMAQPGSSDRGFLTVLSESAFKINKLFDVSPNSFTPAPKVWSSVVLLVPKNVSEADDPDFRGLLGAAFAQKRKTLFNNLKRYGKTVETLLADASVDPIRRAETLTLDEWLTLYHAFKKRPETNRSPARF